MCCLAELHNVLATRRAAIVVVSSSKFRLPALVANEIYFEETFVSSIILPAEPFLTCSILAKKGKRRLCSEGDHLQTSDRWITIFFIYITKDDVSSTKNKPTTTTKRQSKIKRKTN